MQPENVADAVSAPPSGAAGGALDGTYPNPGLAASVAGDGLAESADVLSVNVDGSTLEIASDTLRAKPSNRPAQGRLTLASGDPCPSADQTAKSTLYYTPDIGNLIDLYNGSVWSTQAFTELSIALSGLVSGRPYDVFLYDNAGTLTLELTAWTNDTTRATALVRQDGVLVKSGATTRRYLGTIRTTSATTTEDSARRRFVWNAYNRRRRPLRRIDTTASWTYNVDTIRQARADALNQVEVVLGLAEDSVEITLHVVAQMSTGAYTVYIGLDSTTARAADSGAAQQGGGGINIPMTAGMEITPTVGYHYFAWLERAGGGGTATVTGEGTNSRSILRGSVLA